MHCEGENKSWDTALKVCFQGRGCRDKGSCPGQSQNDCHQWGETTDESKNYNVHETHGRSDSQGWLEQQSTNRDLPSWL